jgi:hypothetical protein
MLKAMSDNTLRNGHSIVFVRGNMIVRRFRGRKKHSEQILCTCNGSGAACHKMADVWSIAFSKNGITLGRAIQELQR